MEPMNGRQLDGGAALSSRVHRWYLLHPDDDAGGAWVNVAGCRAFSVDVAGLEGGAVELRGSNGGPHGAPAVTDVGRPVGDAITEDGLIAFEMPIAYLRARTQADAGRVTVILMGY